MKKCPKNKKRLKASTLPQHRDHGFFIFLQIFSAHVGSRDYYGKAQGTARNNLE